jgi:hypothetical protein
MEQHLIPPITRRIVLPRPDPSVAKYDEGGDARFWARVYSEGEGMGEIHRSVMNRCELVPLQM